MTSVLSLDGKAYPNLHVVSLKRSFSVLDGDNAGRVMTGAMKRDIIGTYYNYSMEIDPVSSDLAEYDEFYEAISAPVDSHVLTVPYAQTTVTFDAYVAMERTSLSPRTMIGATGRIFLLILWR